MQDQVVSGPLPIDRTLTIARDVAAALRYGWEAAGLIHRDVKPANLLIDREGTVKVAERPDRAAMIEAVARAF